MLFNNNESFLTAVCDGEIIPISQIPDEAFSTGILGQGYGIMPKTDIFFAPADGEILSVSDTGHAYTLRGENGAEILVHIGIDTVELKGDGFTPLVNEGQRVKAGDRIAMARLDKIEERGYKTVTAVLITNSDEFKIENMYYGFAKGAEAKALSYTKRK